MNVFRSLAEGGGYSLPYLVHLYNPEGGGNIYIVNDTRDVEFGGHSYAAASFTYRPSTDGSASLEVAVAELDGIIGILEGDGTFRADVVGIVNGGDVVPIMQNRHKYGEATWDGVRLEMRLDKDDRGDMTFPALIFNAYNNRGNN